MTDMTKQTEADRLANQLDYHREYDLGVTHTGIDEQAAAELRRQQAEIERLNEALAQQPAPATELREQEPVLWQILNGVCHAGVRSTENLAKEAAAGMQKTHDLGGSLAAFHVRPLYTSPPAQRTWVHATEWRGLTDEEIERCMKQAYATVQGRNLELAFAHAIEAKLREKNA